MKIFNKKGLAVAEYIILFVIILSAFLMMRHYLQNGIYSSWGKAGQTFGFGRQFDPQKTVECSFDEVSNLWYDRNCFDSLTNQQCSIGDRVCQEAIITNGSCSASSCSGVTS